VAEPVEDGTPCLDGSFCNGAESCVAGACVASRKKPCRADRNPCTIEACDEQNGCTRTPAPNGTACDDGIACTSADGCIDGACQGIDSCAADAPCDRETQQCSPQPAPSLVCFAPGMVAPAAFAGAMTTSAKYTAGNDSDPDVDSLAPALLWADSSANSKSGGSGDEARYTVELRATGTWWLWGRFYYPGEPGSNDANSFRVSIDGAESATFGNNKDFFRVWHWDGDGTVEHGEPVALKIGELRPGAHEVVVEKREVLPVGAEPRLDVICFTQAPEPPDDAEVARSLVLGPQCTSNADCDDRNACTRDRCDASAGVCRQQKLRCDDDNPCTVDACDEMFGCVSLYEPDGSSCEDGVACTLEDTCNDGVCAGSDVCPAGEECDAATGACALARQRKRSLSQADSNKNPPHRGISAVSVQGCDFCTAPTACTTCSRRCRRRGRS
jgi:hypothetical protein